MSNCYRYEFKKGDYSIGILTGLDEFFTVDEICELCWIFERDLKCPNVDMENTISFFTERGNRKFRKAIRKIKNIADAKNLDFSCIIKPFDKLKNVVYQDNYQVILKNP